MNEETLVGALKAVDASVLVVLVVAFIGHLQVQAFQYIRLLRQARRLGPAFASISQKVATISERVGELDEKLPVRSRKWTWRIICNRLLIISLLAVVFNSYAILFLEDPQSIAAIESYLWLLFILLCQIPIHVMALNQIRQGWFEIRQDGIVGKWGLWGRYHARWEEILEVKKIGSPLMEIDITFQTADGDTQTLALLRDSWSSEAFSSIRYLLLGHETPATATASTSGDATRS